MLQNIGKHSNEGGHLFEVSQHFLRSILTYLFFAEFLLFIEPVKNINSDFFSIEAAHTKKFLIDFLLVSVNKLQVTADLFIFIKIILDRKPFA